MGALRDTSRVLENLPQLHIVTGTITYASGVASLASSNDPTVTVADTGTGNPTVTFGEAFLSAPVCTVSILQAADDPHWSAAVVAQSTTSLDIHMWDDDGTPALADPADGDGCTFIAIGLRNL